MPQTKSCFTASQKEKKGVGSTSCHFTLNLVSLVERPFRIKIDVYWWGNSVPRLFMFKLLAGNGTTFEALEHNGALDTGSWERRELDAIQGLKQPSRKRSRGMMEDCLLFPVLSSSGRLSPVRMAQLTPSIAANSNKQDFFFFSHGEVIQGMKVPRSGGYFWEAGGLKTSLSVPVHLWSAGVGQFCQHVVAVCRHSSASLGATALSSLRSRPVDVSCLFFLRTDTKSDNVGSQNKMQAAKKETMLMPVLKFVPRSGNSTRQKTSTNF